MNYFFLRGAAFFVVFFAGDFFFAGAFFFAGFLATLRVVVFLAVFFAGARLVVFFAVDFFAVVLRVVVFFFVVGMRMSGEVSG